MPKQSTTKVLMVRPIHFGFNPQTAISNPFQHTPKSLHKNSQRVRKAAVQEFDTMVNVLTDNGVEVLVMPDNTDAVTPDGVFPNNWFSVHEENKVIFYPILTPNRRLERRPEVFLALLKKAGMKDPEVIDLSQDEEKGLILESTGSMVLDRVNSVAFAMASPRTSKEEFEKWCKIMNYEGVFITTPKSHEKEVYHTNIVMSIGSDFAVVCLDVIAREEEKKILREKFSDLGKERIEITLDQVYSFCGNILELRSDKSEKLLVMSETARAAFTKEQLSRLEKYCRILSFAIPTIEEVGGGGVRCMLGEIFCQKAILQDKLLVQMAALPLGDGS